MQVVDAPDRPLPQKLSFAEQLFGERSMRAQIFVVAEFCAQRIGGIHLANHEVAHPLVCGVY